MSDLGLCCSFQMEEGKKRWTTSKIFCSPSITNKFSDLDFQSSSSYQTYSYNVLHTVVLLISDAINIGVILVNFKNYKLVCWKGSSITFLMLISCIWTFEFADSLINIINEMRKNWCAQQINDETHNYLMLCKVF